MSEVQKLRYHHLQQQGIGQFSGFFDLRGQSAVSTSKNDALREEVLIILAIYQSYFLLCTIGHLG